MEYIFIYLLQFADVLQVACIVCWVLVVILLISSCAFYIEEREAAFELTRKECGEYKNLCKKYCILAFVLGIFLILLPTKQTLLFCGGLYLSKKAVNTITINEKLKKIDSIINFELDKKIKEMQEENE